MNFFSSSKTIGIWKWTITILSFVFATVQLGGKIVEVDAFGGVATNLPSCRSVAMLGFSQAGNVCFGSSPGNQYFRMLTTCPSSAVMIPETSSKLDLELALGGGGNDDWNNNGNNNGNGRGRGKNWSNEEGSGDGEESSNNSDWYHVATSSMLLMSTAVGTAASSTTSTAAAATDAVADHVKSRLPHFLVLLLPLLQWTQSQYCHVSNAGKQVLQLYMHHLESNPLITKAVTSGFMGVLGDFMAQYVEHVRHNRRMSIGEYDVQQGRQSSLRGGHYLPAFHLSLRRSVAILLDGLFISGPLMHLAYDAFEHVLPVTVVAGGGAAAASGVNAMIHVIADSILLDGIFVASAMSSSGLLEGYSFSKEIIPQLKSDYIPAWKASMATSAVMAPIEYACFRYLPLCFRVLAVNFTDIIWDGVVSFMTHRARTDGTGHLIHS